MVHPRPFRGSWRLQNPSSSPRPKPTTPTGSNGEAKQRVFQVSRTTLPTLVLSPDWIGSDWSLWTQAAARRRGGTRCGRCGVGGRCGSCSSQPSPGRCSSSSPSPSTSGPAPPPSPSSQVTHTPHSLLSHSVSLSCCPFTSRRHALC
jgi:hypothetical protein